jgi:hypothetical protein
MLTFKDKTNEHTLALISDAAEAQKAIQQLAKVRDTCISYVPINPSVACAAGIPMETRLTPLIKKTGKKFFHYSSKLSAGKHTKICSASRLSLVAPSVADYEVQRCTGFPTEGAMLSYIFIVCNGDVELVKQ